MQELLALVQDAGHTDFRDARGPLGLTQRQAGGKFTRDEAEALIARLEAAAAEGEPIVALPAERPERLSPAERALRAASTADLAAELQRRGWIVVEP